MDTMIGIAILLVIGIACILYDALVVVRHESGVITEPRRGIVNTIKYLWVDLKHYNTDMQRTLVQEYTRDIASRYPARTYASCLSIENRVLCVIKSNKFQASSFKDYKDRYKYLYELSLIHFYNETMVEMNKYDLALYRMCYVRILWFSEEVEAIKKINLGIPDRRYKEYVSMTNSLKLKYNEVFGQKFDVKSGVDELGKQLSKVQDELNKANKKIHALEFEAKAKIN